MQTIPEYIDRQETEAPQYPRERVAYVEAPGFLTGATRYVPEAVAIALRKEVAELRAKLRETAPA